jgi:hypothetical protein
VRGEEEVSSDAVDRPSRHPSSRIRALVAAGTLRAGLVVCGKRSAYIEDTDPEFVAEVEKYYAKLEVVPDPRRGGSGAEARDLRFRRGRGTPPAPSPTCARRIRWSSRVATGSTS